MTTLRRSPTAVGLAQYLPSSLWVEQLADWVASSTRPEAPDIARDLRSLARRLAPEAADHGVPPSPSWLAALADWVSLDPRPQAPDFARQLRRWGSATIIRLDG